MEMSLERKRVAKQKLEVEIEELKWSLQVGLHLWDDDVQKHRNKIHDDLEAKMEELSDLEDMNQSLLINERQRNGARKELIKVLQDMPTGRSNIGVKRMGEIDLKAFQDACYENFDAEEAQIKASELCALWQEKLKDLNRHPLKVVAVDSAYEEVANEDDELLKGLKAEWGTGVFDVVVTACKELNQYYSSGYVVNELWNFKHNRKATLEEAISGYKELIEA